jgi:hypothetical protein
LDDQLFEPFKTQSIFISPMCFSLIFFQVNRIDNILDSELEWQDFSGGIDEAELNTKRYIRINPDLGSEVPSLDETAEMRPLQMRTINFLESNAAQKIIQSVCHRLVASSFYFEKFGTKEVQSSEKYTCSGI